MNDNTQLIKSLERAEEILAQTGILDRTIICEPNLDQREELWNITRIFAKRIYQLDLIETKSKEEQDECNKLAHYCVVMLHWNDIYDPPHHLKPAPQGRFRRDTLALALCLFTRISRNYSDYIKLKRGWISPHIFESFLQWTTLNIKSCNTDNIFNFFTNELVENWTEGQYKTVGSFAAAATEDLMDARLNRWEWYDEVTTENPLNPTRLIFIRLFKVLSNPQIPYKFALNYIWMNEDLGGVDILSEDRDMNKAFLKNKVKNDSFPPYWDIGCDVVYLMKTLMIEDGNEDEKEFKSIIQSLFQELYLGDFSKEQNNPWNIVVKSRSILSEDEDKFNFSWVDELIKQDNDIDNKNNNTDTKIRRLGLVVDNIRATVIDYYQGDEEKTNKFLSLILYLLQEIAFADDILDQSEYELINQIQSSWGIDLKIWDEDDLLNMKITSSSKPDDEKEAEKKPAVEENLSEFLENYPGELYTKNERWDYGQYAADYPFKTIPFANIFQDGEYKPEHLFRRFTHEEVNAIVKKIEETQACITLPFVTKILSKKFDMRGKKNPFWFDPFIIHGSDRAGLLYFEQNGLHMNLGTDVSPTEISLLAHVDLISDLSVAKGYNGYWEEHLSTNADEDIITSIKIDWYNPNTGNEGIINFMQTNGNKYASTLPIVEAIWNNVWKPVVEMSKGTQSFILPHNWERFDSWQELLDWASDTDQESGTEVSINSESASVSTETFSLENYISTYKENHPKEEQDESLLRAAVEFVHDTLENTDGLLEIFSRTGGYSLNANNKLKNGKFAQVRWSKSDRKEDKPIRYFVDLYLLKTKMNYKIETLPNQSLQSPHAHEFYMVRLYSHDDLDNFRQYQSLIIDSLKAREKNKLIMKRKNLSKKQLKLEFLKDLN